MTTTLNQVLNFIKNEMKDDDRTLIVGALNDIARRVRNVAKAAVYPGMKVTFYSNRSFRDVTARVVKVNRINVDLVEDVTGTRWRVSPQLLKPVGR